MELRFFFKTLFYKSKSRSSELGKNNTQNSLHFRGENGEVILPLILMMASAGLLFGGLFWLNKHFEYKTKEHLSDFTKNWNSLQKKYQD